MRQISSENSEYGRKTSLRLTCCCRFIRLVLLLTRSKNHANVSFDNCVLSLSVLADESLLSWIRRRRDHSRRDHSLSKSQSRWTKDNIERKKEGERKEEIDRIDIVVVRMLVGCLFFPLSAARERNVT